MSCGDFRVDSKPVFVDNDKVRNRCGDRLAIGCGRHFTFNYRQLRLANGWPDKQLEGIHMSGFYRALGCCAGLALLTLNAMPGTRALAEDKKPAAKKPATKTEHDHEHAAQGPHKGALIELGEEEYHGEIVLDEKTHLVTIYLLGSNAKDAVSVEATEVVINLKHGDKPEQFKLKSAPQTTDPKGKSSRFLVKDEELVDDLHHAQAQLRVKIAGKSFIGKIVIGDHDHAGHDHGKKKKS